MCGDVWCINKEEGSHAQRIPKSKERQPPEEHAVLFTCPECHESLHFQGYCGDGSSLRAMPLFFCDEHGFFRFCNDAGLIAGL